MKTIEKILRMAKCEPLSIIDNKNSNRQFPTLANISGTEMIEFYHGVGSGNAIVDDINEEVRGFLYYSDQDDSIESTLHSTIEEIEDLKNCKIWDCEFSATQILFPRK